MRRDSPAPYVELLYFDGCPNWTAVHQDAVQALYELGLERKVALIRISDEQEAARWRFPGSPTLRVNGRDVAPDTPTHEFGLKCRVYWIGGKMRGVPAREWLLAALEAANLVSTSPVVKASVSYRGSMRGER